MPRGRTIQIPLHIISKILQLHMMKQSGRKIARELGIKNETVAYHIRGYKANPSKYRDLLIREVENSDIEAVETSLT